MGLIVKRNKINQYQLSSSISDESYHPKKRWLSQDEAKKLLIEMAFIDFIEKAVQIDMDFPNRYKVNNKIYPTDSSLSFDKWSEDNDYDDDRLSEKFTEVCEKHSLDIHI